MERRMTRKEVWDLTHRLGKTPHPCPFPYSNMGMRKVLHVDMDEALKLKESGMKMEKIGEKLGCSASYLRKHFRAMGVRQKTLEEKYDINKVVKLREEGKTLDQSGKKMGYHPSMVSYILRYAKNRGAVQA